MKELFEKAQLWASQNKDTLIKTGAGILGAVIGMLVAGLISDSQPEQGDVPEWMLDDDEQVEEDENGEEI